MCLLCMCPSHRRVLYVCLGRRRPVFRMYSSSLLIFLQNLVLLPLVGGRGCCTRHPGSPVAYHSCGCLWSVCGGPSLIMLAVITAPAGAPSDDAPKEDDESEDPPIVDQEKAAPMMFVVAAAIKVR